MNKMNIYTLLICNNLSIFFILLLSKTSFAAHYLYEACMPINCSAGPNNISYPFYIGGPHESHCGYPGFELNCSTHGFPTLQLNEHEYVVDQIFYQNKTFHVYDAAVLGSENNTCFPGIETPTLPSHKFDYVSTTARVHLFSGCQKPLPEGLQRYNVSNCDKYWDLAIYGADEKLGSAKEICKRNVVVPVDGGDRGRNGNINVSEVVRKGFTLHWTASDCTVCDESGGRCGLNRTSYHFHCLCADRPHRVSCKPRVAAQRCG